MDEEGKRYGSSWGEISGVRKVRKAKDKGVARVRRVRKAVFEGVARVYWGEVGDRGTGEGSG